MVTAKASVFGSLGQCLPRTCPHGLGNASGLWPRHGVYTLTLSIQRARPLGRSRTGQGLKQEECEPHLEPGVDGVSGREVKRGDLGHWGCHHLLLLQTLALGELPRVEAWRGWQGPGADPHSLPSVRA